MTTTFEKGRQNDFAGLNLIHKFAWLRPTELGEMLWPNSPGARKNMSKLLAKWRKNRYVIERKLPENLGTALVLARHGVELLKRNEVECVKAGKDWGELTPDGFIPPASWKHQLLQSGLAAILMARGYEVFAEPSIRRMGIEGDSIPDLLARPAGSDYWLWCEVESARKTGAVRRRTGYQDKLGPLPKLAETLRYAAHGTALGPFQVRGALVAFDKHAKDERGHGLNHALRVSNALKRLCDGGNTPVTFMAMTLRGGWIEAWEAEQRVF